MFFQFAYKDKLFSNLLYNFKIFQNTIKSIIPIINRAINSNKESLVLYAKVILGLRSSFLNFKAFSLKCRLNI